MEQLIYKRLILSSFIAFSVLISNYGQKVKYLYPENMTERTGRVDIYGKHDDDIRVGNGSLGQYIRGWATFPTSAIPKNACITDLELRYTVVEAGGSDHDIVFGEMKLFPPNNANSGADIRNDIDDNYCVYYCSETNAAQTTGTKTVKLNKTARDNLLKWSWFGVSFSEYSCANGNGCSSSQSNALIAGRSAPVSQRPRLKVTYIEPTVSVPSGMIVGPSSGNVFFQVSSNGCSSWTVEENCSWLSVSPKSGTGNTNVTVIYNQNNSCNSRSCDITFTSGNVSDTYKLIQEGVSKPAQPGSISGPSTPCAGKSYTYSISPVSGATSYTWTLPSGWSGSSTSNTIKITPGSNNGTINVSANNNCGKSTKRYKTIYPDDKPSQPGTITGNTSVCEGTEQTYSIAAVQDAESYHWTFPSGWECIGDCTGTSVKVKAGSSNGNVCVRAENDCGESTYNCLAVSSDAIPAQPGAISGDQSPCTGEQETYSISPVSGATSYTWTLPSGWSGSSSSNSISVIPKSNSGSICVKANNGDCSSSERCLTLNPGQTPSQPGTISGDNDPCEGATKTYSVSSVAGADSYTWTLPDDWSCISNCNDNSITVKVGNDEGKISVTADNDCGSSETSELSVNSQPSPGKPGAITGDESPCEGTTKTYSISPVNGANSYTWSLPDDWTCTSNCSSNSITVEVGKDHGTIAVAANFDCGNSEPSELDVSPVGAISKPGSITGEASPCTNAEQTYSIEPVAGATSYQWLLPDDWSGTSTSNSITVTVGEDEGTICVRAENACGKSDYSCMDISIAGQAPEQPGSISGEPGPCKGETITYSISKVTGANSYNWGLPEGWEGSGTSESIEVTAGENDGNICVTVNNECGTSKERCLAVSTKSPPAQPAEITGNTAPCTGEEITYSIDSDPNASSYEWDIPADWSGSATSNSIDVTIGQDGGEICVRTVNACDNSAWRCLSVYPEACNTTCVSPEAPEIVVADKGSMENAINIKWSSVNNATGYVIYREGDSLTTIYDDTQYTDQDAPCQEVLYEVYALDETCRSENAENDTGYMLGCNNPTSVNSISANAIKIYPNPATDHLTIESINGNTAVADIEIYNALGQRQISIPANAKETQTIDVSDWKTGIYLIRLSEGNQSIIEKLIIE